MSDFLGMRYCSWLISLHFLVFLPTVSRLKPRLQNKRNWEAFFRLFQSIKWGIPLFFSPTLRNTKTSQYYRMDRSHQADGGWQRARAGFDTGTPSTLTYSEIHMHSYVSIFVRRLLPPLSPISILETKILLFDGETLVWGVVVEGVRRDENIDLSFFSENLCYTLQFPPLKRC